MTRPESTLDDLLHEDRRFPPPEAFKRAARVSDDSVREDAESDFEAYWAGWAEELDWFRKWDRVLEWDPPHAKWFDGGQLNAAHNCLDRHLEGPRADKVALIWEGEPGDARTYTYRELHAEVSRFGRVLKDLGVGKGDRVAIYLPMIPEAAIAMLACARIGAPHSVVFGGFSPESLADRINDAEAKLLITGGRGIPAGAGRGPQRQRRRRARSAADSIEHVIVVARGAGLSDADFTEMSEGRDLWWHGLMAKTRRGMRARDMEAEDLLFILYTSGTTGKPKGIVHTTGGYLTQVYATTQWVFDLREDDVFWCTADVGWVTGHSYIVYGPLANGATMLMYEGAPDWPDRGRFWKICERPWRHDLLHGSDRDSRLHEVGRVLAGEARPLAASPSRNGGRADQSRSLDLVSSRHIGGERCPIVDTWWQTETGGIVITPLPGVTETRPAAPTLPFPGYRPRSCSTPARRWTRGWLLAITRPWPSMLRTIWGDDERYWQTYLSKWPTADLLPRRRRQARRGRLLLDPRSGGRRIERGRPPHRHDGGRERAGGASVGRRGGRSRPGARRQGSGHRRVRHAAEGQEPRRSSRRAPRVRRRRRSGAIARPEDVLFSADLPKTRSGKIMRRLLRDIAEGQRAGGHDDARRPGGRPKAPAPV